MFEGIKNINSIRRIRKTMWYSRLRQYFPMPEPKYVDDRGRLDGAEIVSIPWPAYIKKPIFGIVQDADQYPKWTRYRRFLENNSFDFGFYSIHHYDWIEQAKRFDVIIGVPSNTFYDLSEIRSKYEVLETHMGKKCYPSPFHMRLYEDKCLEAYISQIAGLPFATTYISQSKEDILQLLKNIKYPLVSKIIPSSGSQGVELVHTVEKGCQIVKQAFSRSGRKTHMISYRQKNLVCFQEFIPNDGYDIRVIVVGNQIFGFYRKVPQGDFRASGMNIEEMRELPVEAMKIAMRVNKIIKSPALAVDILHGLDGKYYIIEFSPNFQVATSAELKLKGKPGVNILDEDGAYHFKEGRYWIDELALREFLIRDYLPGVIKNDVPAGSVINEPALY